MILATSAFGRREFALCTPREEPSYHILMLDVVAGLHLAFCLTKFGEQSLLVSNIGFNSIGDDEVRTSARSLRQLCQAAFGFRLQSYAKGCASCVRHKHILPHPHLSTKNAWTEVCATRSPISNWQIAREGRVF